jgi:hypothetical protein
MSKVLKGQAREVWEAFCGELTQAPTDDMREALSTAIRKMAEEFQYYQFCQNFGVEDLVVDARDLYDLAEELDSLPFEWEMK